MKAWLLLFLLAGCRCQDHLVPYDQCGQPCWPDGGSRLGACHPGLLTCDDDGGQECVGYGTPSPEVCDNVDNDCDGFVDVSLYRDCTNACGWGEAHCVRGVWEHCTAPTPQPEVCNGYDDDCNGLIDDNLPTEFCYDAGAPATVMNGTCRPGVTRCVSGQKICANQVGPQPEVCNGLDDNCNGQVDEGLSGVADVVFIADCAGEDFGDTLHLISLIHDLAVRYGGDARFRFAWVCTTQRGADGTPYLFQNLVDPNAIDAGAVWPNTDDLDDEPNLDALKLVADFGANPLGLSWRPSSKRFAVILTDECAWTDADPTNQLAAVEALVDQDKLHVFIFTMPTCDDSFGTLTDQDGGFGDVGDLPTTIEARLESVFDLICQ